MRFVFYTLVLFFALFLTGCWTSNGTEEFYARHPEYDNRPSYFDKTPDYDDQDLNDRYSGNKD
jgi:hypothetical protein